IAIVSCYSTSLGAGRKIEKGSCQKERRCCVSTASVVGNCEVRRGCLAWILRCRRSRRDPAGSGGWHRCRCWLAVCRPCEFQRNLRKESPQNHQIAHFVALRCEKSPA